MGARFWINPGGGWEEITDRVNLSDPPTLTEKAEEGSVAMSTLTVDDRDLDLVIDPFTPVLATEDTSESDDQIWFGGLITGRRVVRVASKRDPFGRFWVCDVADANERFHRRVFKAADAKRPAETDNERAEWALQQLQDWGLVDDDTTYFSGGAASGDLDKEDLRGRYPDDVVGDAAEAKSKNWWLQRQGEPGSVTDVAWWGRDGVSDYESPLYLTNDPSEINEWLEAIRDQSSVVWPLRQDHGLRCIPDRLYSGAWAKHRTGALYRRNAATADVIGVRDIVMSGTEEKSKAATSNRMDRYLDDLADEEFRVEAKVRLPAARVTQLRAGMRVPVAMTHWPYGFDDWYFWRVVTIGVTPAPAGPWYDVDLELASTGDAASGPPSPPGPPWTAAAIAAIINLNGDGATPSQEGIWTGDAPGAGYSNLFTVGPFVPVAGDPSSITATADVVVRITAETWVNTVVTVPESATLQVLVNGVQVGTDTISVSPPGAQGWHAQLLVDVSPISLSAGDVVTHRITPSGFGPGGFGDDFTIKWSSSLIVGRGSHTISGGSAFGPSWVGP